MADRPNLILASNSPRRQQLLSLGGWSFEIKTAEVDEIPLTGEKPAVYVQRLAAQKATAVTGITKADIPILAADTTVADQGDILGKPEDAVEARLMLRRLRGGTHQVYTAIAVYHPSEDKLYTDLAVTDVPMRNYTDAEIEVYIQTGDAFDKAGSYAIQHAQFHPVASLSGCYANVVGLPLCHLARTLNKLGLPPKRNVAQTCQIEMQYRCPVYSSILKGDV